MDAKPDKKQILEAKASSALYEKAMATMAGKPLTPTSAIAVVASLATEVAKFKKINSETKKELVSSTLQKYVDSAPAHEQESNAEILINIIPPAIDIILDIINNKQVKSTLSALFKCCSKK